MSINSRFLFVRLAVLNCFMRLLSFAFLVALCSPATAGDCSDHQPAEVAIDACTRQIKSGAADGSTYSTRAYAYLKTRQFDQAIGDFTEAIRRSHRESTYAYNGRGNAYHYKGDNDRAIADYTRAISLNPLYAYAYNDRGEAYREKGDLIRALADFTEAIRVNPRYADPLTNRGLLYELRGEAGKARVDFEAVLQVPKDGADSTEWAFVKARERLVAMTAPPSPVVAGPSQANASAQPASPSAGSPSVAPFPAVPLEGAPALTSRDSRRLALVIGNATYANVSTLPNPRHDADSVAASLRSVGFQIVTVKDDMTRAQMISALNDFSDQAANADWALIYFSGHGLELGGSNYVVPIDANLRADRDVQDEAVSLDRLLSATMGARKLHIVILDACRDNPFIPKMRQTVATRSIGRGLARVEPEGATLVVYAARDGQIAYDGDGQNSPFVTALTKRIAEPNLEINKLFRLVHDDVLAATDRRQEPYVYGALPGEDFYFVQR